MAGAPQPKTPTNVFTAGSQKSFNAQLKKVYTWYTGGFVVFIVALAIWDFRTRGKLHPVTRWGGLALIVSQPARLALSGTAVWLAFATWLTSLAR